MKKHVLYLFLVLVWHHLYAQQTSIDSLKQIIDQHKGDTSEVNALAALANSSDFPEAVNYAKQSLKLAQKIKFKIGEANCNLIIADWSTETGQAIKYALNALDIYEGLNNYVGIASAHLVLQANYREVEDYTKALFHEFKGEQVAEANNVKGFFVFPGHRLAPLFLAETGQTYVLKNQLDSALIYVQRSIEQNELFNGTQWEFPIYLLATIQQMKGDYTPALENYHKSIDLTIKNDNPRDTLQIYSGMSTLFKKRGLADSCIYYAQIVAGSWDKKNSEIKNLLEAITNLADVYKARNKDSAIKYVELSYTLKDSLLGTINDRKIQSIGFDAQLRQEKQTADQAEYRRTIQLYASIVGFVALLLITGILWRSYKQQRKAKTQIEAAYKELKSTQAQLIQSEKMASLGELTAGIAHEIQNPLNFVNNFSEVNGELIKELKREASTGNMHEVTAIADDIEVNSEKINHHGKRADTIVKGMLQHSRTGSGIKEPSDINRLADEYLRLAYQGFRARDKSFNPTFRTEFDNRLVKVNIVPQDIGRVILNLINNAFYAVHERSKEGVPGYEPTVIVGTRRLQDRIEISVKDNGNGIPEKLKGKIFQPFFTTKPTGQGTGLGLSLAYDIVKAHGGEIKVESKEGKGSVFIIQLTV